MSERKPLFIPLKGEFYDAFANGTKCVEYRLQGRRWNAAICHAGRKVVLSRGYGKRHRLKGMIVSSRTDYAVCETDTWKSIYGNRRPALAIEIEVKP